MSKHALDMTKIENFIRKKGTVTVQHSIKGFFQFQKCCSVVEIAEDKFPNLKELAKEMMMMCLCVNA